MNNLMVLMLLFAVASCGNSSDKKGNQMKSTDALNGPLSYSFVEGGERACKTGRHSFESKEAMCMALQNQDTNNSCATLDRFRKFDNECTGLGFRWIESAQCDLYVLKKDTRFPGFQEADVLAKRSVCAGRMQSFNWSYLSGLSVEGALYDGTRYEMSVEPKVDSAGSLKATVSVMGPDGRVTFSQNIKTNLMDAIGGELDGDLKVKIHVRCFIKDACRDLAQ